MVKIHHLNSVNSHLICFKVKNSIYPFYQKRLILSSELLELWIRKKEIKKSVDLSSKLENKTTGQLEEKLLVRRKILIH